MIKTILREAVIIIALIAAIVLVLGLTFYDQNPVGKEVSNKVAYTLNEEIRLEIDTDVPQETTKSQDITYSVTEQDLRDYKVTGVYDPGNPNPFQPYSTGNENTLITNGTGNGSGGSTSGNEMRYYPTNRTEK